MKTAQGIPWPSRGVWSRGAAQRGPPGGKRRGGMRGPEGTSGLPATKIVCTIGPASADRKILSALIREGMSVARFNFSHGPHAWHGGAIARIREEAASQERHVAIMQDLQGPKIRLGTFSGGKAVLARGSSFTLTTERVEGNATVASVASKGFSGMVARGG